MVYLHSSRKYEERELIYKSNKENKVFKNNLNMSIFSIYEENYIAL